MCPATFWAPAATSPMSRVIELPPPPGSGDGGSGATCMRVAGSGVVGGSPTGRRRTVPPAPSRPGPDPWRRTAAASEPSPSASASAAWRSPGWRRWAAASAAAAEPASATTPRLELRCDDVRRDLMGARRTLDGRVDRSPRRGRPGEPPEAVPASGGERLVANGRARVRSRHDRAAADVHADVVRRSGGGADEHQVARRQRLGRLRRGEAPQVGRGRAAREHEAGRGVRVVDQPGAVEPALRTALASPDVRPSDLRLRGRDGRQRAARAVQIDRAKRLRRELRPNRRRPPSPARGRADAAAPPPAGCRRRRRPS